MNSSVDTATAAPSAPHRASRPCQTGRLSPSEKAGEGSGTTDTRSCRDRSASASAAVNGAAAVGSATTSRGVRSTSPAARSSRKPRAMPERRSARHVGTTTVPAPARKPSKSRASSYATDL